MTTTTYWKSGLAFESHFGQYSIVMDTSGETGGTDSGFTPRSLLLSALAGCTGMDVVSILEKMKVPFHGIQIDVSAGQTIEDPKVFKDIFMTYKVKSLGEYEEKIKRAVQLSYDKYCGVAAMLKKHSPIHVKVEIEE